MTDFIALEDIKLKPRQRKEMDQAKFDSLYESIKNDGLLHAIVIDFEQSLLVGGRRHRVMTKLHADGVMFYYNGRPVPQGKVPFTKNFNGDELRLKEIELAENMEREDLSWPDRVAAMAEIHRIRVARDPKQSFVATAREIVDKKGSGNVSTIQHEVSRSLITADFLDDPDVKKARNEKEAFNVAINKLRQNFAAKLPPVKSNHEFIEAKAEDALTKLIEDKKKFKCFVLDPPYGVDAQTFTNKTKTEHRYDDSAEYAMALNKDIIEKCFILGEDNSHLWLFCDIQHWFTLQNFGIAAGWTVWDQPIIWNSGVRGHIPNMKIPFRRNHEMIMFMMKGDRGIATVFDDVINGIPGGTIEYHAAEKPRRLYELLLKQSVLSGDSVLDPCCGSGTIFRAAHTLNLHATGIDNSSENAKFCQAVLAELVNNTTQTAKPAADDELEDF